MNEIKISKGGWSANIISDYGMNATSVRCDGKAILREPESSSAFAKEPVLYGIPVLLPANRTSGGRFTFEGREYRLPINEQERGNNLHGSLYNSPFEVLELTENTVKSRLVNRGEHYPFDFTLEYTDSVSEAGYLREIVLTNDSERRMPYTFALHSTFVEPRAFTVPIGERFEWDENYIPTGKMLPLDEFEERFNTSCTPDGREISAPYTSRGNVVLIDRFKLTVSENFDEWVFYNGNGHEGYLCIECQCGEVNGLNREGGHRVLEAGESVRFTFALTKA